MDYTEVQRYARVYAKQELYAAQQRRVVELVTLALGIVAYGADPSRASPAELDRFRRNLFDLRSELFVREQLAQGLTKAYREALE